MTLVIVKFDREYITKQKALEYMNEHNLPLNYLKTEGGRESKKYMTFQVAQKKVKTPYIYRPVKGKAGIIEVYQEQ